MPFYGKEYTWNLYEVHRKPNHVHSPLNRITDFAQRIPDQNEAFTHIAIQSSWSSSFSSSSSLLGFDSSTINILMIRTRFFFSFFCCNFGFRWRLAPVISPIRNSQVCRRRFGLIYPRPSFDKLHGLLGSQETLRSAEGLIIVLVIKVTWTIILTILPWLRGMAEQEI